MTYACKACKRVEELYKLRKDTDINYQILQAPFYYLVANVQATYIENETDTMGQLTPLVYTMEESDDEEEIVEIEDQEGEEEEKKQS